MKKYKVKSRLNEIYIIEVDNSTIKTLYHYGIITSYQEI